MAYCNTELDTLYVPGDLLWSLLSLNLILQPFPQLWAALGPLHRAPPIYSQLLIISTSLCLCCTCSVVPAFLFHVAAVQITELLKGFPHPVLTLSDDLKLSIEAPESTWEGDELWDVKLGGWKPGAAENNRGRRGSIKGCRDERSGMWKWPLP